MNADQKALVEKTLADFHAHIVELEQIKHEGVNGYVVKVGPLWIKFAGANYSKPGAVSAGNASVIRTYAEAYRVGKMVQNGGGDRGLVQKREEAIDEQIESLRASIAFLQQLPANA
jgi:hypothetical protein